MEQILTKIITEQIKFNNSLNASNLYDEIINTLIAKYSQFGLIEKIKNPQRIEQSENFKYLICLKSNQVQIINKFHN